MSQCATDPGGNTAPAFEDFWVWSSAFTCGPWLIYGSAAKVIVDHFRPPLFGVSEFVKSADVAEGHVYGTDGTSRLTSQQLLVTGSLGAVAFLFARVGPLARIRAREDVPGSDDSKWL